MNKLWKLFKKVIITTALVGTLCAQPFTMVQTNAAGTNSGTTSPAVNPNTREDYLDQLGRAYRNLKESYNISDSILRKMDKIYNDAYNAINYYEDDDYASMSTAYSNAVTDLNNCVKNLSQRVGDDFLIFSNDTGIATGTYGERVLVPLSMINLGTTTIYDILLVPQVSNDVSKWPFVIEKADDGFFFAGILASNTMEEAYQKRMNFGYTFLVREDVLTGCYPINFDVYYTSNGQKYHKVMTTYVNMIGQDPKKALFPVEEEEEKEELVSKPRIIVTGFKTVPETVYAGDTFELQISLKNTSSEIAVKNVLFDLEASVGGTDTTAAYSVFLPTSGSNSIYTEQINPGETFTLSIEMEAKADLSQKPYALKVDMKYDTKNDLNLSDSANVSIPVKQESKVDTGSAEVLPDSIAVGEESNIMFDVFNTGKTTLYNVKVTFSGDTVTGGITYLGNIQPGETKNTDAMVTGAAQDMGDGIVKAIISYEDDAGVESFVEKDINLYVYEAYVDDYSDYDDSFEDVPMEETNSFPVLTIVIIAVVVVVVVVVAIVVILKVRKAKKHKEDLDTIDDEL